MDDRQRVDKPCLNTSDFKDAPLQVDQHVGLKVELGGEAVRLPSYDWPPV